MAPVQGLVTLVLLGSQKKLYAIVEFVYRESALRVLQHPDTLHLHGEKLVVKPREVKPLRRDERAKEEEGSGVMKETSPPLRSSLLPCFVGGVRVSQEAVAELQQATSVSCLDAIQFLLCTHMYRNSFCFSTDPATTGSVVPSLSHACVSCGGSDLSLPHTTLCLP